MRNLVKMTGKSILPAVKRAFSMRKIGNGQNATSVSLQASIALSFCKKRVRRTVQLLRRHSSDN